VSLLKLTKSICKHFKISKITEYKTVILNHNFSRSAGVEANMKPIRRITGDFVYYGAFQCFIS